MYAIYGNMDPINIPQMLAYIYHTWIYMDHMGKISGLNRRKIRKSAMPVGGMPHHTSRRARDLQNMATAEHPGLPWPSADVFFRKHGG
jgi:hypothetical protein